MSVRPRLRLRIFAAVLPALLAPGFLVAQTRSPDSPPPEVSELPPAPRIVSHSGTPPLLEIEIPRETVAPPGGAGIRGVTISGGSAELRHDVEPREESRGTSSAGGLGPGETEGAPLTLQVSPFLQPGSYDLNITVEWSDGTVGRYGYRVGFVDFVWGRDNFQFGNNADYESRLGNYSRLLEDWLEERFGGVSDGELALLVDYMYGLFGKNAGRCYAFTGTQLRYWRRRDLLPSYYENIYDIRQRSRSFQREMLYRQFDIVYDQFLTPAMELLAAPQPAHAYYPAEATASAIVGEVRRAMEVIDAGEPVILGLVGPQLHHSVLGYGYIRDDASGAVTLLVANNWKSGEERNTLSRDAELLQLRLDSRGSGGSYAESPGETILWRHIGGVRERQPDRIFLVDLGEEYDHDPAPLRTLLARRAEELRSRRRGVVVVEEAKAAWLQEIPGVGSGGAAIGDAATGGAAIGGAATIAGDDKTAGAPRITGYRRGRTREGLAGVTFDRVQRTYRFEFSLESELALEFVDDEGARLLGFFPTADRGLGAAGATGADRTPGAADGDLRGPLQEEGIILETEAPSEAQEVHRRLLLERVGWSRLD